jgi:hypothetical protein
VACGEAEFALGAVVASRYGGGGGVVFSFAAGATAGAYWDLTFVADVAREAVAVVAFFVGLEVWQRGEVS